MGCAGGQVDWGEVGRTGADLAELLPFPLFLSAFRLTYEDFRRILPTFA